MAIATLPAAEAERRLPARFTALEIACGTPLGLAPALPTGPVVNSPRRALDAILRDALSQSPCLVAFSGGRDSSALLAAAVALARREGLEEPIPVTLHYDAPRTQERDWQELVLAHLRVSDWVQLRPGADLDLVGPVAAAGLLRHGVLYPANTHVVVPLARAASGGALLTGVAGDDVFGHWPWHEVGSLVARRRGPRGTDVRRLAHALAPAWLRAEIARRREPLLLPWIVEPHRRQVASTLAAEYTSAPRTWSARMRWLDRWRAWRVATESMALLARDEGARLYSPFLDPPFLASLAAAGGRTGWGRRADTMQALFGDLLPDALFQRATKAEFSAAFFGTATCEFAARWDGSAGAATELIDVEALRRVWCSGQPHFASALLLQTAWLAAHQG